MFDTLYKTKINERLKKLIIGLYVHLWQNLTTIKHVFENKGGYAKLEWDLEDNYLLKSLYLSIVIVCGIILQHTFKV